MGEILIVLIVMASMQFIYIVMCAKHMYLDHKYMKYRKELDERENFRRERYFEWTMEEMRKKRNENH